MKKMRNVQVIENFLQGYGEFKNHTDNLYTDGVMLSNYGTLIALRYTNIVVVNSNKYSQTTSTNQNKVKRLATNYHYDILEADESTINSLDNMRLINFDKFVEYMDSLVTK